MGTVGWDARARGERVNVLLEVAARCGKTRRRKAGKLASVSDWSVLEICAGGGGQAVGLERAGFHHAAAVEIDSAACATLRLNRPSWKVLEQDVRALNGADFKGVDLIAGGVPCPPFSIAGKQLGSDDERDLFPAALNLIQKAKPRAVLLENVPGFASSRFDAYRNEILLQLTRMKMVPDWRILNACDFGVPQLRPRFVLVALREDVAEGFAWPTLNNRKTTVGEALRDLMAVRAWPGANDWSLRASGIGPTVVGGSKKHGGPDLGPTRARAAWAALGVDGRGVADQSPDPDFPIDQNPRLTVPMVARIQGFPDDWAFSGKKTAAYRQVGNAFPPPVATAVGGAIYSALAGTSRTIRSRRRPFQPSLHVTQAEIKLEVG